MSLGGTLDYLEDKLNDLKMIIADKQTEWISQCKTLGSFKDVDQNLSRRVQLTVIVNKNWCRPTKSHLWPTFTSTTLTMNWLLMTMYMVTMCLSTIVWGILTDQVFQAQNSSVFPACIHTYQDIEWITPHSLYWLLNHQIDVSVRSFSASMMLQTKHKLVMWK